MPIYEYRCEKCGHQFDMIQKMSDSPVQKCEKCGEESRRIISQTSFMLKGTGWYATDYAGKKAHKEKAAPAKDVKAS
ncbi:MAG: zinc ribbon domain-containing protein [Deltaproteobacteria bacterium]|nr:zinc ribbon domain-containing protein [Deltaproteobacteria bacterium]